MKGKGRRDGSSATRESWALPPRYGSLRDWSQTLVLASHCVGVERKKSRPHTFTYPTSLNRLIRIQHSWQPASHRHNNIPLLIRHQQNTAHNIHNLLVRAKLRHILRQRQIVRRAVLAKVAVHAHNITFKRDNRVGIDIHRRDLRSDKAGALIDDFVAEGVQVAMKPYRGALVLYPPEASQMASRFSGTPAPLKCCSWP